MLTFGFTELGLHAVNAWTVEINIRRSGSSRRCTSSTSGGSGSVTISTAGPYDRLLFDLLATEHQDV